MTYQEAIEIACNQLGCVTETTTNINELEEYLQAMKVLATLEKHIKEQNYRIEDLEREVVALEMQQNY